MTHTTLAGMLKSFAKDVVSAVSGLHDLNFGADTVLADAPSLQEIIKRCVRAFAMLERLAGEKLDAECVQDMIEHRLQVAETLAHFRKRPVF